MNKTILVADDDQGIIQAMTLLLEDEGYRVIAEPNGKRIVDLAAEGPDLILLDIWMSGADGGEVAKQLKSQQRTKDIPIIMVSANRDTEQIARESGAEDFLAKPFDVEDLLELIKKHT